MDSSCETRGPQSTRHLGSVLKTTFLSSCPQAQVQGHGGNCEEVRAESCPFLGLGLAGAAAGPEGALSFPRP